MPKVQVDFSGPSQFGGKHDELVLCAGKGIIHSFFSFLSPHYSYYLAAGDIHIWDRDTGALLHHIRTQALGGDLTCVAWNHASEDPFMFATGSHDGAVRIWTAPPPESDDDGLNFDTDFEDNFEPRPDSPFQRDVPETSEGFRAFITEETEDSDHAPISALPIDGRPQDSAPS